MSVAEEEPASPLKRAALEYASRGWHVVPLYPNTPTGCGCGATSCDSPGKHPIPNTGLNAATSSIDDVDYYWDKWPDANIGVVAGPSGLAIVDVDSIEAANRWKTLHPDLAQTYTVKTGRGYHLYYSDPTGQENPHVGVGDDKGIDLRAGGSYVVAPPSTHYSGNGYELLRDVAVRPLPLGVQAYFAARRKTRTEHGDGAPIPRGQRDQYLTSLAGTMRSVGMTQPELEAALIRINADRVDPPLDERDIRRIARSVASYAPGEPRLNAILTWGTIPNPEQAAEEATSLLETWSSFRDHTTEEITWVVDGLISESSLTFIAAPPKAGKTWVALSLAVNASLGKPFLNRPTEPVSVVYVALEGHRSAIKTRTAVFARGSGANPTNTDLDNLHFIYKPRGINISDPSWAGKITAACEQVGARILIVDVLRKAAPGMREDGQGAADFGRIVENLGPLQDTGCAVVLLHHFVKLNDATRGRTIGERMSGSGALFGHADLVLGITASENGAKHLRIEAEGRDIAAFEPLGARLVGEASGEYGGFGYSDAISLELTDELPAGTPAKKSQAAAIKAWLQAQPNRDAHPSVLAAEFNCSEKTITRQREELAAIGVLYQSGGGGRQLSRYYISDGETP